MWRLLKKYQVTISLILLRDTQSALTAAQASIKKSEAVALTAESLITIAQDTAPHFPSDSAMTFNAQAYNTSSTAPTINSCSNYYIIGIILYIRTVKYHSKSHNNVIIIITCNQ